MSDAGAQVARLTTDPPLDVLRLAAEAHALRFSDMNGAVALAGRALHIAEGAPVAEAGVVSALRVRSSCLARLGDLPGAEKDLARAEAMLTEVPDAQEVGWVQLIRAQLDWRQGRYLEAMRAAERALELHQAASDEVGMAEALLGLGRIAESTGDEAQALRHYHASRTMSERVNDSNGIAAAVANIGSVHGRLNDTERALAAFAIALPLSVAAGNRTLEARILSNIAGTHGDLGLYDTAMEHAQRGLALARTIGDRRVEVESSTLMGQIYARTGDVTKAEATLRDTLMVCRQFSLSSNEADARFELGCVLLMCERYDAARMEFESVLANDAAGGSFVVYLSHQQLATLYQATGDLEKTLYHERRYHVLKDATLGLKAQQRIRTALIEAEREQAEHDGQRLREHNEQLRSVNEEKTQLLVTLSAQTERLARLSIEDGLTGVFNRRHLDECVAAEWHRTMRFGHALTFALLDIDHFKSINDRYSHSVGDAVLRAIASYLRSHTRQVDVVARYGGEEFAVIYVATTLEDAATACDALRNGIAEMDWSAVANDLRVTVSIGVAAAHEVTSVVAMMGLADGRLYAAKASGRNCVRSA